MRHFLILCLVVFTGLALPGPAFASKKVSMHATVAQVRLACSKVGGVFSAHADGGGYGCDKPNCDGAGGHCEVQCDNNNNCTGVTPARVAPQISNGVIGILSGQNGQPESGGGEEDSSKPEKPKKKTTG